MGTEPSSKVQLFDIAMRVAFPIMLAVGTAATGLLWSHEGRITTLEVRSEGIIDDVKEIKSDVKKLLGGN